MSDCSDCSNCVTEAHAADDAHGSNFISPVGYRQHECGYCKGERGPQQSRAFYAQSASMTPSFYQSLLSRGWRRSGKVLYKPDLANSCCAQYTIRLPTSKFHPSKDQRQAINRFNRYIVGDTYIKARERYRPKSKEESLRYKQEFNLTERVHEAESSNLEVLKDSEGKEIKPDHELVVALEKDEFTEEKFTLYENYQRIVHHEKAEDISRGGLKRFLCSSPLPSSTEIWMGKDRKHREKKLGSFHQTYRIDGKLVAMAVLDLLPHAVSAVYFMYDESLHRWSPGKLSALREASMAAEKGYEFYWMGFYIQTCAKMRYKGDFSPVQVLDPISYGWWEMDQTMRKRMQEETYVSLARVDDEEKKRKSTTQSHIFNPATSSPEHTKEKENKMHTDASASSSTSSSQSIDAANEDNLTLWSRNMPGILPLSEVKQLDLGKVKVDLRGVRASCEQLNVWQGSEIGDPRGVRSWVGELVAAVGKDAAQDMVVKLA